MYVKIIPGSLLKEAYFRLMEDRKRVKKCKSLSDQADDTGLFHREVPANVF